MRMRFRCVVLSLVAAGLGLCASAADGLSVVSVTARQRYPWNGKVDISYEVAGAPTSAQLQSLAARQDSVAVRVTALDRQTGKSYVATTLEGDAGVAAGRHSVVWDMWAQGLGFVSDRVAFSVALETVHADGTLYCIVDLSGGPDAEWYPVSYGNDVPAGGWSEEHKTSKLVLRRIPAGTFTMGSNPSPNSALYDVAHEDDETEHSVTFPNDFYIGVFEVTQRQWELVMDERPSRYSNETYYASRPVENVSYDMIRGLGEEGTWPETREVAADSFVGLIREKTGLAFDLPTEAQWEYACRAGTTTPISNGSAVSHDNVIRPDTAEAATGLCEVARWLFNSGATTNAPHPSEYTRDAGTNVATAIVGSYKPNNWGLYDVHGNVMEWCLDWRESYSGDAVDPQGSATIEGVTTNRVCRGGGFGSSSSRCRSASRGRGLTPPSLKIYCVGLRLACNPYLAQTFDPCGGTADVTEVRVPKFGTLGTLPRATRDGYGLVGWYTEPNGGGTIMLEDTQIARDMTLYACWIPQKYCVIDLSEGNMATNYPVSYFNEIPEGGWTDVHKTTKLVLSRVPAGSFLMGSPDDPIKEPGRMDVEDLHRVTLSRDYYVGVFEVTQRQWELVMGDNPSYFINRTYYASRPVEQVTYDEIRGVSAAGTWPETREVGTGSFVDRIRRRTGLPLDLPTEAQWEYACRAGTTTALNNGTNLSSEDGPSPRLDEVARWKNNCDSSDSRNATTNSGTAAVGSYRPNAWGLYDMHGNVSEWCLDWYGNYSGDVVDPSGADTGDPESLRVIRGGGWSDVGFWCRSACRFAACNDEKDKACGLRLVCNDSDITLALLVPGLSDPKR